MPNLYEWEVFGARNPKSGELPYLGIVTTDTLDNAKACEQAKHDHPAATFVQLAEGQGRKIIILNVDEVLENA